MSQVKVNRAAIKVGAKAQIKGKLGGCAGVIIVYVIIYGVLSWFSQLGEREQFKFFYFQTFTDTDYDNPFVFVNSLARLALVVMALFTVVAFAKICLNLKDRAPQISDMLFSAKNGRFPEDCLVVIRIYFFTFLWSLLLIVPGIIKGLSYSMTSYLRAEKDISAKEAQRQSIEIMRGHKGELFVLGLSFIGWYLLVVITFGLASFYVVPYAGATMANFYREVSIEDNKEV